ncbi:tRNA uridine-5-carboxymethylaminomethyl(34) synthesis GTPase MnmE [Leucothrix arctica]|uniref:tRNA modification GTPase MnmE n=1 Tax=Leucothrix arctica TaxID=1481894 RepID=A0A317CIT2_9GAMM|nr:tRNA uridine-5-carboxymethylaminomethyl(34) synthesis GTPase MnmE [Leucothrix arctica]PWQ97333.1 tRNA uridine-5-carboxymethylaminomethyl(34) synthesis GTPase MnmE [Leucothrix arctica]
MHVNDTIAAIATPAGRGGVGIIRLSGPKVSLIAESMLGQLTKPHRAAHRQFLGKDGTVLDDGVAIYFPGPHSFTGEDVLELQGHGGKIVMDMLLQVCLQNGARLARPGEFSERAFLNDKLDLAQAEAIADLIDSSSEQAARSAIRSLQGDFSAAINSLLTQITELRIYVEAALDFPEEEIDFLADQRVLDRVHRIQSQLGDIFNKAKQGSLLREGMQLVIVGKPNAGKSSLLNALAGQETAIVTEYAGTTRDVLRESINLDGMPLHIIDTAGLRESDDPVEKIGIQRAWQAVEKADLILFLVDDTEASDMSHHALLDQMPEKLPRITVHNKIDKSGHTEGLHNEHLYISAKQHIGIDTLRGTLKQRMGYQGDSEDLFIARRRHLHALEETQVAVDNASEQLQVFNAGELMAEELRVAQDALGQITGRFTPDDLLGEIFSSFCIGK